MKSISTSEVKRNFTIDYSGNKQQLALFNDLYDRYAPAFYGEIKRNLYQKVICDQTLVDAFQEIWEKMSEINASKDNCFIWCFRIVHKQISKKKIDLLLKEIFAFQNHLLSKVA